MKKPSNPTGNQTCDLLDCKAECRLTASLRIPSQTTCHIITLIQFTANHTASNLNLLILENNSIK